MAKSLLVIVAGQVTGVVISNEVAGMIVNAFVSLASLGVYEFFKCIKTNRGNRSEERQDKDVHK